MFAALSPNTQRVLNSLAYTALVAVVAGLGYLTFEVGSRKTAPGPVADEPGPEALIDVDAFSTRLVRTTEGERLNMALRLRLTRPGILDCHVYLVARNDRATPKLWAVWPPEAAGSNVTGGGHFRGGATPRGEPISVGAGWTRVAGTVSHPTGRPPFETVVLYVVARNGQVLLARPFPI